MLIIFSLATAAEAVKDFEDRVAGARQAVAAAALNGGIAELASAVNHVAENEGALHVLMATQRALDTVDGGWTAADPKAVVMRVMTLLEARFAAGADDKWSGRENDVRRAYADGVAAARARVVQELLSLGMSA